jgi:hypothetical protein
MVSRRFHPSSGAALDIGSSRALAANPSAVTGFVCITTDVVVSLVRRKARDAAAALDVVGLS